MKKKGRSKYKKQYPPGSSKHDRAFKPPALVKTVRRDYLNNLILLIFRVYNLSLNPYMECLT